MDSEKAAAVRDSVNGCPTVANDEDFIEREGREILEKHTGESLTGDHFKPRRSYYRPAYIKQSGTFGDGNGRTTPVYVVVLETLWTQRGDVRLLSAELVFEIAKHGCRIRFYPPEHRLAGDIWIVDNFAEQSLENTDGNRCSECGSTYFKLRSGTVKCARCGATRDAQTEVMEAGQ